MRYTVITLFPNLVRPWLEESLLKKALERGLIRVEVVDLRAFGLGRHRTVDDTPYGGGAGMVIRPDVAVAALEPNSDFIIIDCSPSLGLITVNALTAADSVVIPVQAEFFALEGLGKLLNTIKIVQSRLNTELVIEGILMTMYDGRLRLCNQVVSEVRRHFDELVFSTIIHRNARLAEAPSAGKPVILYDGNSKGSANYLNLAKEILQKNDLTKIKNQDRILE